MLRLDRRLYKKFIYIVGFGSFMFIFGLILNMGSQSADRSSNLQANCMSDSIKVKLYQLVFGHGLSDIELLAAIAQDIKLVKIAGFTNPDGRDLGVQYGGHVMYTFGVFEADANRMLANGENITARLAALGGAASAWYRIVLKENDPRLLHRNQKISVNRPLNTHYIFCNGKSIVHLAVLIDRVSYYYVGKMAISDLRLLIWYCGHIDIEPTELKYPFAVDKFVVDPVQKIRTVPFQVFALARFDLYAWHMPNSLFIECHYEELVWPWRKIYSSRVEDQDNKNIGDSIMELRKFAVMRKLPVVLYAGSLLGWYRQCDYITYSADTDFVVEPGYLDEKIFRELYMNSSMQVAERYGKPGLNEALELVTYSKSGVKMDLFTLQQNQFKNVSYTDYYSYSNGHNLHRETYPNFDLSCKVCVDMNGALIYAPCDPLKLITAGYGIEWFEPREGRLADNLIYEKTFTEAEYREIHYVYSHKKCKNPQIMWGCDDPPPLITTTPVPTMTETVQRIIKKSRSTKAL